LSREGHTKLSLIVGDSKKEIQSGPELMGGNRFGCLQGSKKTLTKSTAFIESFGFLKPQKIVKFEVFTPVTMKNGVFWDVVPCRSSETSLHTRSTRRHIPEDGILHKNLDYIFTYYKN
jgi:hypothetical protein